MPIMKHTDVALNPHTSKSRDGSEEFETIRATAGRTYLNITRARHEMLTALYGDPEGRKRADKAVATLPERGTSSTPGKSKF